MRVVEGTYRRLPLKIEYYLRTSSHHSVSILKGSKIESNVGGEVAAA